MQRSSSNVDQIIAEYSYNRSAYEPSHITPVKRPNSHRDDRGPFDTIPLPPLSRTTSQASANSMASTTFLLDQHRHPSTVAKRSTGFHWPHPFQTRKERYSGEDFDAEKLSPVDSGGGGGGGGRADDTGAQGVDGNRNGKAVMKPWHGWREVLFGSWFNLLLVFLPASWVVDSLIGEESKTLVFIFCILAMMPLVKLHDLAIRDLAPRLGGSRTGLLNASMSNIVEIVIGATALNKCELSVVQSTLIGSMLSKLLLVLGLCFFAGGLRFTEQAFDSSATQIHSSLLSISVGAVLLPAAYHFSISGDSEAASIDQRVDILQMSHGVAIILLVIYFAYLFFQLYTHRVFFKDKEEKSKTHELQGPTALKPLKTLYAAASKSTLNLAASSSIVKKKRGGAQTPVYPGSPSSSRDSSPEGIRALRNQEDIRKLNEPNSPYAFPRSQSQIYLNSPYASASDISLPLTGGMTSRFLGDRDQSKGELSPTSAGSSATGYGYVYTKGGSMPAPAHGTTVKLVPHHAQMGSSSSAGSSSDLPPPAPFDVVPVNGIHFNEEMEYEERHRRRDGEGSQGKRSTHGADGHPQIAWPLTLGLLIFVTVLVAVNAEWLVEAMDGMNPVLSKEWIALIMLPAISSIAECATAMNVSVKDQLTLSIAVAIGSTIQTALFVVPLMIILGWALGKPIALLFDPFQSVVLYISVHTMGYVVADGKSNWLEGAILICLYIVIAVCFWFYPGSTFSSTLATCATTGA